MGDQEERSEGAIVPRMRASVSEERSRQRRRLGTVVCLAGGTQRGAGPGRHTT